MAADVITDIVTRRGRCKVTTQSGHSFVLPKVMLRQFPLKVGETVVVEAYLAKVRQAERPEAMKRAAWLLGRRDYTAHLLGCKLTEAGFSQPTADEVVAYLQQARYVDDVRYAHNLVNRRKSKHGARRIAQELRMKGIEEDVREQALETLDEAHEAEQAERLLAKYLRGKVLEPQDAFRRSIAYLARRGFGYDIAKQAYSAVTDDLERE